jgi:ribonuclease T2
MTHQARLAGWAILVIFALGVALAVAPAAAPWDRASHSGRVGHFDYFVLSLSWSPEHCASATGRTDEPQCGSSRQYGFVVHGLWPQSDRGSLDSCAAGGRLDPSVVDGMLDLMPSPSLVRHEWKKHGTCTGMPPAEYFARVRVAHDRLRIPDAYRDPKQARRVDAKEVRKDFLQANPGLDGEDLAVICRQRHLREIRVCLDKELRPTACGPDVRDQCRGEVVVRPVR